MSLGISKLWPNADSLMSVKASRRKYVETEISSRFARSRILLC